MGHGRFLRIGGYVSGGLLMAFGIAVIALGIWGFTFARDHIEREGITFGPATDPAVQEHAEQWADEPVDTGRKALAMAEIMREHTLSSTGGLTYAEMGRFQSAENPDDPKGTNDEAAAAKDESGQPVSNGPGTSGSRRPRSRPRSTWGSCPRCSPCSASSSASRCS